jgi:hypothetical protein
MRICQYCDVKLNKLVYYISRPGAMFTVCLDCYQFYRESRGLKLEFIKAHWLEKEER